MKEQSLVLLKPDAVQRGLVGEIIQRFERCGITIVALKLVHPTKEQAGEHYFADEAWVTMLGTKQKESYKRKGIDVTDSDFSLGTIVRNNLISFLQLSPVVVMVLEGHNTVAHVRKLVGPTAPSDAAPGTIRGDLSFDTYQLADVSKRPIQNLIHASGTVDEAKREIAVWFKKEEIYQWQRVDEALLYRKG